MPEPLVIVEDAIDDNEIAASPDSPEEATQLEELLTLLEKAHQNQGIAEHRLAETAKALETSNHLLREEKNNFNALTQQTKTITMQRDTLVKQLDELCKQRDNLIVERNKVMQVNKEETLENAKLHETLNEMKANIQALVDNNVKLKNLILKQHQLLSDKDNEIVILNKRIESLKSPQRSTFFNEDRFDLPREDMRRANFNRK